MPNWSGFDADHHSWPCPPCRWETPGEGDSGRVLLHIRDWHHGPKLLYTLDLRQQRDYSDEQIDRWYAAFLDEVEAVQRDQVALLRYLIHHEGVRTVYVEGLTEDGLGDFRQTMSKLRREPDRLKLLDVGAPGRLMLRGELREAAPLDDDVLPFRVFPLFGEEKDFQARHDWMVKAIRHERLAVVSLGSAHTTCRRASGGSETARSTSGWR